MAGLEATLQAEQERLGEAATALKAMTERGGELQQRLQLQAGELAGATTELRKEREQGVEKLALLNEAREQLTNQFKALAGEILEEKSRRFTEQNERNIGQLLDPLKTKLTEFQAKVEEVQKEGIAGRSELKVNLDNLQRLNQQLSEDAANLVTALRGSAKTQGDWGEFILEQILESSGLRKDIEYSLQGSFTDENNRRARPDVIVNLPGGKHLVLDSKLSLLAYTDYCNADSEAGKSAHLKAHLASVRAHVTGLAKKDYQTLYQLTSLDFVVMFIPVEPAFMLAIAQDDKLWQEAYAKNVLLVSPTTLLFVIRTVANLWRQENQTRSVNEIVRRGAALYDKFVGFVVDLEKIGERLSQANSSYDAALQKLKSGPGNVIRQVEMLRQLGVKPSKTLSPTLLQEALDEQLSLIEGAEPLSIEDSSAEIDESQSLFEETGSAEEQEADRR
jgi:DNA recombination protein RmuC